MHCFTLLAVGSCLPHSYTNKICLATGASVEKLGEAAACAVKRINLDMRMAYAARKAGAELREDFEVVAADFNKQQGLWNVSSSSVSLSQHLTRSSSMSANHKGLPMLNQHMIGLMTQYSS